MLNPQLIPLLTFVGLALVLFLLGRSFIRVGRARHRDALDHAPLVFGVFTTGLAYLLPNSGKRLVTIRRELKQAGYYHPLALEQFLAVRNSLVFGWLILCVTTLLTLFEPGQNPTTLHIGLSIAVLVGCFAVPRLYLQAMAAARVQRIQRGLPDALDMITMCVSGGMTLQSALERVSKEIHTSHVDLVLELEILRRQAEAYSLEHALRQMADRIDIAEVKSLTAIVSHTERLGTNVAVAITEFADSIRRSYRQRAEERGNKNSVKMLLPVALCLAPPIYILLLAPAALEIRDFVVRENRPGGVLNQPTDVPRATPAPTPPA